MSVRLGIGRSKIGPSAVADTVTMAPARKQNMTPLARLYSVTSWRPQIFSSWKYSVSRARVAMGAVRVIQLSTANRLPSNRPTIRSKALTPRGNEQRADHQLRARHVFPGVHADKTLEPEQRPLGNRLAFEFCRGR